GRSALRARAAQRHPGQGGRRRARPGASSSGPGAAKPTSLRHDAAEAVLLGLWGVLEVGWLDRVPVELRR
ncbi:hypothetical protein ACLESO_56645, partial [Pyxidicoccus sp. 3LG]